MKISKSNFAYSLPPELVATEPISPRDASRMLWLQRRNGEMANRQFLDLPQILPPRCLIIVNNSKVIPARLQGQRATGGKLEILLLKEVKSDTWECKVKNSSRLKIGEKISLAGGELTAEL